jgi:hypothetical protein
MYAGERRRRRHFVSIGLAHLVMEPDRLVLDVKQHRVDGEDIARQELALLLDGLLDRRHAALIPAQECGREPECMKEVPRPLVELADVPHDVHVAHLVAVPRIHRALVGQ